MEQKTEKGGLPVQILSTLPKIATNSADFRLIASMPKIPPFDTPTEPTKKQGGYKNIPPIY